MSESKPKAVIFDLDGTLYLGEGLIPGADNTVRKLRLSGVRVVFMTNKPIASPASYAKKLTLLGIEADSIDVITSVELTRQFLTRAYPGSRLFIIGESYLTQTLVDAGFSLAARPEETDVVVVSLDRELGYEKLYFAYRAVLKGAAIIATNPDLICPMGEEEIIDAGATIAALEALLKRPIDDVLGKPSRRCAEVALSALGCQPSEVLMVGDRMETDIRMAAETGMRSGLVLSGVSAASDVERYAFAPDYIWQSVADLPASLGLT